MTTLPTPTPTPTPKRPHAPEEGERADSEQGPTGSSTSSSAQPSKRARRSRWEQDGGAKATVTATSASTPAATATQPPTAAAAAGNLSEIVKRLSSVVKEKATTTTTAPNPAAAIAKVLAAINNPPALAAATTPVDAAAAKARALAQASLLSLSLPSAHVSPSDFAKRVYIGNLYYELKEDDIRHWFAPVGTIHSIDLAMEPGVGRSKGFCFIEYEDALAAECAIQVINGTVVSNRSLRVGRPHRGNSAEATMDIGKDAIKDIPTKCIYVGSVRMELNAHHLESIFSPFGEIRASVMAPMSSHQQGAHRGYGFIEFADEVSAGNAIQHMNGFELAGQKLKVGKASPSAMVINLAVSHDKIVHTAGVATGAGPAAAAAATGSTQLLRQRTTVLEDADVDGVKDIADGTSGSRSSTSASKRCLCLLNLVKVGDVDAELQEEVQGECGRFGTVERVEIHELGDHVRVFVVFATDAGAAGAQRALHGRFFGGNRVQAEYYPLAELDGRRYRSGFLV